MTVMVTLSPRHHLQERLAPQCGVCNILCVCLCVCVLVCVCLCVCVLVCVCVLMYVYVLVCVVCGVVSDMCGFHVWLY